MISLGKREKGLTWVSAGVACAALLIGCSGREHPQFAELGPVDTPDLGHAGTTSTNPDEKGGASSRGGASNRAGASSRGGESGEGGEGGEGGDGVPTDFTSGIFDPESVYLFGTLAPTCNFGAVSLVVSPNVYSVGFGCYVNNASVQIWNKRLVYADNTGTLRIFVPDYSGSAPPANLEYPKDPAGNDMLVDVSPCQTAGDFLSSPDGRLIYVCEGAWYEAGQKVAEGDKKIAALGFDGWAMLSKYNSIDHTYTVSVMNLSDGVVHGATIFSNVGAIRAHKDAFHFMAPGAEGTDHPDTAMWKLDFDGNAEQLIAYPDAPGLLSHVSAKLMSNDDIYTIGNVGHEVLLVTPNGVATKVYPNNNAQYVLGLNASLFTGP